MFTFPQPGFSKFIGIRFAQPLDTVKHIVFVSLGLLHQTDSHHSALWTQTNFDLDTLSLQPGFSDFINVYFAQPFDTNIHIGFVSLGLLDQTNSHHSALQTQTNFDLGSLSLSLVSQILLALV